MEFSNNEAIRFVLNGTELQIRNKISENRAGVFFSSLLLCSTFATAAFGIKQICLENGTFHFPIQFFLLHLLNIFLVEKSGHSKSSQA